MPNKKTSLPPKGRLENSFLILEKTADFACFVNVNLFCGRHLGQTGHCHNITCKNNNEACTCRNLNILDCNGKVIGCTELCGVIGEAVLCFCNADGKLVKAEGSKCVYLPFSGGCDNNASSAVNLL